MLFKFKLVKLSSLTSELPKLIFKFLPFIEWVPISCGQLFVVDRDRHLLQEMSRVDFLKRIKLKINIRNELDFEIQISLEIRIT